MGGDTAMLPERGIGTRTCAVGLASRDGKVKVWLGSGRRGLDMVKLCSRFKAKVNVKRRGGRDGEEVGVTEKGDEVSSRD